MKKPNCVILLSGGIDSTTMLYRALKFKQRPIALSFDYGQQHKKELECAKKICRKLKVPHKILQVDLRQIGGSMITSKKSKQVVVPYRNTIFLSLAAAVAEVNGIHEIWIGAVVEDYDVFRDCRESYFDSFERTLSLGGVRENRDMQIVTPYLHKTKDDIVKHGLVMKVPYELTWTCYKGGKRPCGICSACKERRNAFFEIEVEDPLLRR